MLMSLATTCAPLVHPSTVRAIVATESRFNANAIGVVAGVLERQPRNTAEALETARALRADGRNFSVGLAQINVRNLPRLGLSLRDAFDGCKNLAAMQTVLAHCFDRARVVTPRTGSDQPVLRKALSCYYSGNFSSGLQLGYVRRVAIASSALRRHIPTLSKEPT